MDVLVQVAEGLIVLTGLALVGVTWHRTGSAVCVLVTIAMLGLLCGSPWSSRTWCLARELHLDHHGLPEGGCRD